MAQFPALPLWTDAYLGDTSHLTTIEHGAYLLLLMSAWRSPDCRLPNDDKLLARFTRLNPGQWKRIKPIILSFFDIKGDWIYQGRLTDEREAVKQHCERQSRKSKARWLKNKESGDAGGMPRECRSDAPTPTPTPTPKEVSKTASAGYVFEGKVIKLNAENYDDWESTFSAIPDFKAYLAVLDTFYDGNLKGRDRQNWFIRCSSALGKRHQEFAAKAKAEAVDEYSPLI
jgi:uncharacterized protein YdaU (DUF1376 family)